MSAVLAISTTADTASTAFDPAQYTAKLDASGDLHEVIDGPVYKVPLGCDLYTFTADRSAFPDAKAGVSVVKYRADVSFDGGQTWQLLLGYDAPGGACLDPNGNVATVNQWTHGIPQPNNPNRQVRLSMTPLVDLKTDMQVTFSTSKAAVK